MRGALRGKLYYSIVRRGAFLARSAARFVRDRPNVARVSLPDPRPSPLSLQGDIQAGGLEVRALLRVPPIDPLKNWNFYMAENEQFGL